MGEQRHSLGDHIADTGCGLSLAGLIVCVTVAVCIRVIRWGLS